YAVELVRELQPGKINFTHYDFLRKLGPQLDGFIVAARADRAPVGLCDFQVVQSPANAAGPNAAFIAHWPVTDMQPRDPERGADLTRAAYLGRPVNLSREFLGEDFARQMNDLGIDWRVEPNEERWNDYREVDAVLAVRDLPELFLRTKPTSKLVNAWLGGCVPLMGPEPAYRHVGDDGRDYFEVRTPADALRVLRELKADPSRLAAVRRAGSEKAARHTVEARCAEWWALFEGPVAEAFGRWQKRYGRRPGRLRRRRAWQKCRHKALHTWFWGRSHRADRQKRLQPDAR
ncbi:MAG: glycosyltransferase, partial [Planctomycetota bacterium]